jgi:hypothetical protein
MRARSYSGGGPVGSEHEGHAPRTAHAARFALSAASEKAAASVVSEAKHSAASSLAMRCASKKSMRACAVAVFIVVSGCAGGCGTGFAEVARLRALNVWTYARQDGAPEDRQAALAVLDSLAARRPMPEAVALGGKGSAADSLMARLLMRRAYIRWAMGDTSGAFSAYVEAVPVSHLLLRPSDGPEVLGEQLRSAARVASDAEQMEEAARLLDHAERVVRDALATRPSEGLREVWREILTCKLALSYRQSGRVPPMVRPAPQAVPARLFALIVALIAVWAACLVVASHRLSSGGVRGRAPVHTGQRAPRRPAAPPRPT